MQLLLYRNVLYLFYLGNFNAPIFFLGLVRGGIVVPGTVIIDQLPVPLSYTGLNKRKRGEQAFVLFSLLVSIRVLNIRCKNYSVRSQYTVRCHWQPLHQHYMLIISHDGCYRSLWPDSSPWYRGTGPGKYPWRWEHDPPTFGGSQSTAHHSPAAWMNTTVWYTITNTQCQKLKKTSCLQWLFCCDSVLSGCSPSLSELNPVALYVLACGLVSKLRINWNPLNWLQYFLVASL